MMLFYIPIYNRTRSEFEEWLKLEINKAVHYGVPYKLECAIIDRIEKEYGRSWEQNHAVGWIKIEKGQGGFSFIIAKIAKSSRSMKSNKPSRYFELISPDRCYGGYHIISFKSCKTPDDYMEKFEKIFREITEQDPFKNCFIDYSSIKLIYKYVDWNSLIDNVF